MGAESNPPLILNNPRTQWCLFTWWKHPPEGTTKPPDMIFFFFFFFFFCIQPHDCFQWLNSCAAEMTESQNHLIIDSVVWPITSICPQSQQLTSVTDTVRKKVKLFSKPFFLRNLKYCCHFLKISWSLEFKFVIIHVDFFFNRFCVCVYVLCVY